MNLDESGGPYILKWWTAEGQLVGTASFTSKQLREVKMTELRAANEHLVFEENEVGTA